MLPRMALDDVEVFARSRRGKGVRARCHIPAGTEVGYVDWEGELAYVRSCCGCVEHGIANLCLVRSSAAPDKGDAPILLRATRDIAPGEELLSYDGAARPAKCACLSCWDCHFKRVPVSFQSQFFAATARIRRYEGEKLEALDGETKLRLLDALEQAREELAPTAAVVEMRQCPTCRGLVPFTEDYFCWSKGEAKTHCRMCLAEDCRKRRLEEKKKRRLEDE